MKTSIAFAGCCVAGLCLSNLSQAQPSTQEFQLAFCNLSKYSRVLVAIAHRQDGQRWTVDGWYPVSDYGCSIAGTFKGDTVYYYAFGETRDGRYVTWSPPENDKSASSQCVDHNKFFRVAAGMPSCGAGFEPARFRMIRVGPNQFRITWTLSD